MTKSNNEIDSLAKTQLGYSLSSTGRGSAQILTMKKPTVSADDNTAEINRNIVTYAKKLSW